MKNRYLFFKKLYLDYVILFKNDEDKISSLGIDKRLEIYLKNNDINYVIIDSNNEVDVYKRKINNYKYYVIKEFLYEFVEKLALVLDKC